MRNDAPRAVMVHKDFYKGGKALLVLGGPSAVDWELLHSDLKPDVVLGANGANSIRDLDYWLCVENMNFPSQEAEKGGQRYIDIMDMFQITGATTRMVNRKSINLLKDRENVIPIRRSHLEVEDLKDFTFREYGEGFINGALMQRPEVGVQLRAGTVGLQLLHLAGILGVSEIHTIGYDLCLRGEEQHHWYKYPVYEPTRFYNPQMFTSYEGYNTLWFWVDTMLFLKELEQTFDKDGIKWYDYSDGLLQLLKKGSKWN